MNGWKSLRHGETQCQSHALFLFCTWKQRIQKVPSCNSAKEVGERLEEIYREEELEKNNGPISDDELSKFQSSQ